MSNTAGNPPTLPTPVIEIEDLVKEFRLPGGQRKIAVDHTTWSVHESEVVAFLGVNGAGKSTTIDMMLGLINPTSGSVRVLGQDPVNAARSGQLGAVLQSTSLLENARVGEILAMVAAAHNCTYRVPQLMKEWNLEEIARTQVKKCSGGQKQRISFALGMMSSPKLLILDEPTTGLDVNTRRTFWQLIHQKARQGTTVVFATHYLEEAENFADRVVLIDQGRIIADGTMADIRRMSSGTRISADVPNAAELAATLRTWPDVYEAKALGNSLTLRAETPEAVTRWLLNNATVTGLEVVGHTLEDAFTHLTNNENTHGTTNSEEVAV